MKKKMSNRDKTFWAVVIPVVVLFFAFNTLPMIKGVIYSFTNYKGYGSYDYVGLRNYTDLFTDARVGKSYLFLKKFDSDWERYNRDLIREVQDYQKEQEDAK